MAREKRSHEQWQRELDVVVVLRYAAVFSLLTSRMSVLSLWNHLCPREIGSRSMGACSGYRHIALCESECMAASAGMRMEKPHAWRSTPFDRSTRCRTTWGDASWGYARLVVKELACKGYRHVALCESDCMAASAGMRMEKLHIYIYIYSYQRCHDWIWNL